MNLYAVYTEFEDQSSSVYTINFIFQSYVLMEDSILITTCQKLLLMSILQ